MVWVHAGDDGAAAVAAPMATESPKDERETVAKSPRMRAMRWQLTPAAVVSDTSSWLIPQFNEWGEVLLTFASMQPTCRSCMTGRRLSCTRDHVHRPRRRSHAMFMIAALSMIVAQWIWSRPLPHRVHQCVGGILLASTAGTGYFLLCYLLYALPKTSDIGQVLLDRANPFSWEQDKIRFFLEVCSWVAAVWYSYATFHSEYLTIISGPVVAIALALLSDFFAAYVRVLHTRVNKRSPKGAVWIKVVLSYACMGYIISGSVSVLRGFLYGEKNDFQTIDDLAFNYLLITMVGVSLVIASELLLLYEPTRIAGIILQNRIAQGRKNWDEHMWRSMMEIAVTFGTTVVVFRASQDILASLQLGTCCGVFLILAGEFISSTHSVFTTHQDKIPDDHWIKLIPLVGIACYFCFRVGSAAINLPADVSLVPASIILVATIMLTILAITGWRLPISKMVRLSQQWAGFVCFATITLIALKVCHGVPAIIFSSGLSCFCVNLSRECWNDIQAAEDRKARGRRSSGASSPRSRASSAGFETSGRIEVWSRRILGIVKKKYAHLYSRIKWTFIYMVILASLDLSSTLLSVALYNVRDVSLSQLSAGNVVVSTAVGYLSSSIQQELHPEVLVQSGLRHFKNKWLLFPLHAFVETTIFFGVFVGTLATRSTVFSSVTLAALSGIVVSAGGHWVCSRLQLTVGTRVRVRLTATCALVFCLLLFTYAPLVLLSNIYHYFDSIEAAFCLASLSGIVFLACSELFLLWEPTREIGRILQQRVTHAKENWLMEPLRSFLELFTWVAVIYGSFAIYDDLWLALQLGTFSGIAVTLSGEYFRRNRSKLLPLGGGLIIASDAPSGKNIDDLADDVNDRSRALPVMLLFAYIGSGTFQWIFENIRSLEVIVALGTIAGIAFLCIADLLALFKPTRWAGIILQDRFINIQHNWKVYPVRSFVEFGCFLGVIYGSYAIYHDLVVAVHVGALSGMLVTLIGEQVRSHARVTPPMSTYLSMQSLHVIMMPNICYELLGESDLQSIEKTRVLPLPVMGLLGLVGAVAFNIIYTHLRSIEVAFVLATTSGVAFALLGDMFVIWAPTRKVGLILQERILFIKDNFAAHASRTWMELASLTLALHASYAFFWPGDLLVAIQFGTFSGIMTCVCDELLMEYIMDVERRLLQGVSAKLSQE